MDQGHLFHGNLVNLTNPPKARNGTTLNYNDISLLDFSLVVVLAIFFCWEEKITNILKINRKKIPNKSQRFCLIIFMILCLDKTELAGPCGPCLPVDWQGEGY